MKHLFYFKKGDKVPQWLMAFFKYAAPKNTDGVFCVNGKVCVDDSTGNAILWPAKKHYQYIMHFGINTDDNENLDNGELSGAGITGVGRLDMYGYSTSKNLYRKRANINVSPLTRLRRNGELITTSTKCSRIPCAFHRVANGSPLYVKVNEQLESVKCQKEQ